MKLLGLGSVSAALAGNYPDFNAMFSLGSPLQPNILLIVFDALTARDMSLYGFNRPTTPNLERFAAQSAVYHNHYAAGNFTSPGTASLLTGVMPWTHRVINLQSQTIDLFTNQNLFSLLPNSYHKFAYTHNSLAYILLDQFHDHIDDLIPISDLALFSDLHTDSLPFDEFNVPFEAELLSLKNTFAVNSSLFLSSLDRIQRKIQSNRVNQAYRSQFPRGLPNCRLEDPDNSLCFTVETAVDWLVEQSKSRLQPYFGYVHLFPPHSPYNSRKEFIGKYDQKLAIPSKPEDHFSEGKDQKSLVRLRQRYDETIADVDFEFGRLFDHLRASGALENTCLIVTSDHGELLERGISGHNTPVLYEPLIHIPLIISYPGQTARTDIYSPTHAVDLLPTILDLSGAPHPATLEGLLLPTSNSADKTSRDLFVIEAKSSAKQGPLHQATFSLVRQDLKMIYYHGYEGYDEVYEVFDLVNDPEEIQNIYSPIDKTSLALKDALLERITPYL